MLHMLGWLCVLLQAVHFLSTLHVQLACFSHWTDAQSAAACCATRILPAVSGGHARGAAASQAQENAVASLHPAQEEGRKAARTTKRTTREAHQTALRANLQKVLVGTKGTPQHLQTMLSRNQATAGRARRPTRRGGKRKKPARTAAAAARDHS